MSLLTDIGGYLDTSSASLTLGTNFFYSLMPESPDNCVAIYQEGGTSPISTLGSNNAHVIERPQLQILVRNTSYESAESLAYTLFVTLTSIVNQSISGNTYLRVEALGSPTLINRDNNKRSVLSCNFDVQRLKP